MAAAASCQQPTPERFFGVDECLRADRALKSAIELEFFTAIGEGNTSAATIAKRCKASERGRRSLCDFFRFDGFLTKEGTQYGLLRIRQFF